MPRDDTQNQTVLAELKKRPLTTIDAFQMGITRLAARIFDLRQQGHRIHSESKRTNGGARVAEYHLLRGER